MTGRKIKRLKIFPNVRVAYAETIHDRLEIIKISWLAILLSFLTLTIKLYYPTLSDHYQLQIISNHSNFFRQLVQRGYLIIDEIFVAIIYVCLLRKILLLEQPKFKSLNLKTGGEIEHTRHIFFYWKFGKREFLFALWTIILLSAFEIFRSFIMLNVIGMHIKNGSDVYYYTFLAIVIAILRALWPTIFFLTFPYLAIAENPKSENFPSLIKSMFGNIFRATIINFFIFLPYFIFTWATEFIWIKEMHFLDQLISSHDWILASRYVGHLIYFGCIIVSVYFSANVYKNLYLKDEVKRSH